VVLSIVAVVLAVSGGFRTTVGGFRISARSPLGASIAGLIAGGAWFALARRDRAIAADLEAAWRATERNASRLIGMVALIAAIVASTFATRSAAGADASGYLSQAQGWTRDPLAIHFEPLSDDLDGPDEWATTPLGWRPQSQMPGSFDHIPGGQVPTYPPGLPLLMSIPHVIGGLNGAYAVVLASAAIAVWATAMIAGGVAGVIAAFLIAFSPVFLYQSFQPMSDVPVTAAWMLCFLLLRNNSAFAGVACAMAILIRPNLAPLAIVPLFMASGRRKFAAPVAIAGLFLALLQFFWYGSPWRSGYGTAAELFALANVVPNAGSYFNWLVATAPVLLLAPFGFMRLKQHSHARALIAFALLVIAAYLVYAVFDQWSYLRFLLPAMAVFAIFAAIELSTWVERWPVSWRAPILLGLVLTIIAHSLFVARSLDAFKLADQLRRVGQVADFVNNTAPAKVVLVAGEQSGSMRYYTGRSLFRWEAIAPEVLAAEVASLQSESGPFLPGGWEIYVVLDAWEDEPFLSKFKNVPAVALDWPPLVDAGTSHRTKVWRLSDRAKFLAGEHLQTIRLP
jgi:hypothetical protein